MKKLYLLPILLCLVACTKTYKVKVVYCDPRPAKIIYVNDISAPDNSDIQNIDVAVPKYRNEMNVCQLIVLQEIKE